MAASNSSIEPFSYTTGDLSNIGPRWRRWLNRFELYADSKNLILTPEKEDNRQQRRALLLHLAGEEVQDVFDTLQDTGNTKDYDSAVKALKAYFIPKSNSAYARHAFKNTIPAEGESVSQYHIRLAAIAKDCGYAADCNNQIRDQILFHCESEYLQRKLLEEGDDLTLQRTLQLASECERIEERMKNLRVTTNTVNKVSQSRAIRTKDPRQKESDKADYSCYRCGGKGHYGRDPACPARGRTCHKCQGADHFSSMCRTKQKTKRKEENANQVDEDDTFDKFAFTINAINLQNRLTRVTVGGVELDVLVDTGASVSIIDQTTWKKLKSQQIECQSYKSNDTIKPYGSPSIPVIGKFDCDVTAGGITRLETFSVIEGTGEVPLLSRHASTELGLVKFDVNKVDSAIVEQFSDVFEGLGRLKDRSVKLHIKDDIDPVAQPLRRTPFQIRDKVKEELDELLKLDIIEPVDGPTPWVNPIVVVPKANGRLRLCLDMRRANEAIVRGRHPIPTVEELLQAMNGATVFSKVDLRMGYHQLELEPESRAITTFTTHVGLFRYKRLFFGINSATEQYQYEIQTALSGLQGAQNISDDIIIYGKDQKEHDKHLQAVMQRLRECGLTLNKEKCQFNMSELVFMGLLLSEKGIGPTESKVKAIVDAAEPKNASEVRSFLGLAAFNARFIPDFATVTEPLRQLTHKGAKFVFEQRQRKSFNELKTAMKAAKTLAYFDVTARTQVIADASPVGLGGILIQIQNEQPVVISYASRSLTPVEQRYSQTEKEALGLVWACERFHPYIYGVKFELLTDHKPLETIYGRKSKPCARVERWVLRLQSYEFEVKYIPGKKNIADALSRLIKTEDCKSHSCSEVENYVRFVAIQATPAALKPQDIERASDSDSELNLVRECIRSGQLHKLPTSYQRISSELCIYGQLILRGTRIVVPEKLRSRILALAHEGHLGIVNTKQNLRTKVWWPNMDTAAERFVRGCHACQMVARPDPPEPIRSTELPPGAWQDLATDLLGPLPSGDHLLVVVDYFSRYVEVSVVKQTTSEIIIQHLEEMFCRHGYPVTLKSDNGPQFRSGEFQTFCGMNNIEHIKVTARYAQANGEVERQNSSLLKRLQIAQAENKPWKREMNTYLLASRSIPHATTGISPAELLFSRKLRTKLPVLEERPNSAVTEVRDRDAEKKGQSKIYVDGRRNAKESDLQLGDQVLVRQEKKNKLSTNFGEAPHKVVQRDGNSLVVESPSGVRYSRNTTHVKRFMTQQNEASQPQCESPVQMDSSELQVPEIVPPPQPVIQSPPTPNPVIAERTARPQRTQRLPRRFDDYEVKRT